MKLDKISRAQEFLRERKLDGWLLYDFHRCNELAHHFLEIPTSSMTTRRFFYWIPVKGEPVKLVHAIEAHALDRMKGEKRIYSSWQSLENQLGELLRGKKRVAMEYSPRNAIPYVSKVDGGTIDFVRSLGVEVIGSADFLLHFTSVLNREQIESQRRAANGCREIVEEAWNLVRSGRELTEWDLSLFIQEEYRKRKMVSDGPPIVAVNAHSADPHFSTARKGSSPIRKGDFLLIDLWAKEEGEKSVFGDLTRVAVVGREPSQKEQNIFAIVRKAQKNAIELVRARFAAMKEVQGWEVDEAARNVIRTAGYGDYFIHRTGHNIEVELHGSGTHMDNLEMHDVRPLLPMTCFSVEPGIYLPGEFGVRLESDVLIHADGLVEVTGGEEEILKVL